MEKKNTMLLTVIAVSTLLVAVVGATFAYFTATQATGKSTTVEVTTETMSSTTASASSLLELGVTAADMVQPAENDPDEIIDSKTAATLSIETENSASSAMTCTYDILYSTSSSYTKTTGFTSTVSNNMEMYLSFEEASLDNATSTTSATISNFDLGSSETTIASGLSFTVAGDSNLADEDPNTGSVSWDVNLHFVNSASMSQDSQQALDYSGSLSITNIDCTYETAE